MAYSPTVYLAVGTTQDFVISHEYVRSSHIHVYIDDHIIPVFEETGWTFTTGGTKILLDDPVAVAASDVTITRETPSTPVVDFQNGAGILEKDLDDSHKQNQFYVDEQVYLGVVSMGLEPGGNWDAETLKIVNLVDPTGDQDAATKGWVDTSTSASAAAAAQSASDANTDAGIAANAAQAAVFAQGEAETAAQEAETAAALMPDPISSGDAGDGLRINAGKDGYEYGFPKPQVDVLTDTLAVIFDVAGAFPKFYNIAPTGAESAIPLLTQATLVCSTTERGFAVGDETTLSNGLEIYDNVGSTNNEELGVNVISLTGGDFKIVCGRDCLTGKFGHVRDAATGAFGAIDATKWKVRIKAWY